MRRTIFTEEHELFRRRARAFFDKECAPYSQDWEAAGGYDREVWRKAGAAGLLGWEVPEEFGGAGVRDFRYNAIMAEEQVASGSVSVGLAVQNDVVAPLLLDVTDAEQKRRWLPGFRSGEIITALAVTEPGAGADVKAITTSARRDRDAYLLNGTKTFITNGIHADLVVVAARTDPAAGPEGVSLLVVERGMPGFERGRKPDRIGLRAQDSAELYFRDVRVPAANLLGEENQGFAHLTRNLPRERLAVAVSGVAVARRALELTLDYVTTRTAIGQRMGTVAANRFVLAEIQVELQVAHAYIDRCIEAIVAGELSPEDAAGATVWATELQWDVVDRCLQLFGGYGSMNEYEIARLWRDSRVQRLYGGTNEIMKELIGRDLEW